MPVVTVSDASVTELAKPADGQGGFEGLLKRLQDGLDGNELTISDEDIERVRTYSGYGQGGFEDRLAPLLEDFQAAGILDP